MGSPGARRSIGSILASLAAVAGLLPAAAAALSAVRETPAHGGAGTAFTVTFRAPIDTTADPYNESYEMSVKGPKGGCAGTFGVWTSSGRPIHTGQLVHVRVRAPYRHSRWCPGSYGGVISETSVNPSSSCEQEPRPQACGEDVTLVGRFSLRVRR
jgi:hypothetical protein